MRQMMAVVPGPRASGTTGSGNLGGSLRLGDDLVFLEVQVFVIVIW